MTIRRRQVRDATSVVMSVYLDSNTDDLLQVVSLWRERSSMCGRCGRSLRFKAVASQELNRPLRSARRARRLLRHQLAEPVGAVRRPWDGL